MSSKKNKIKTVSDKIAEKFLPKAPVDPENDPESLVKIADFDEDADNFAVTAKPSEIRRRNTQLLSEFSNKYKGKVTSRKELDQDSETSDGEVESDLNGTDEDDSSVDDSELEEFRSKLKEMKLNRKNADDSESDLNEEEESHEGDSDFDDSEDNITGKHQLKNGKLPSKKVSSNSSDEESEDELEDNSSDEDNYGEEAEENDDTGEQDDTEKESEEDDDSDYFIPTEETNIISESYAKTELKKGYAVQNQLKIWEKLLEIRIHSQKIANQANCLPPPTTFNEFCDTDDNFYKLSEETATNIEHLLENMLEIQYTLASQYSEMKDIFKNHRKRPPSANKPLVEPPIKRFAETLSENHESFTPYRNATLQKWDDRVKVMNPPRGKKGANLLNSENDVLQRIEFVLQNKNNLIAKSQTIKGNYKLFGYKEEEKTEVREDDGEQEETKQMSPEIYDDTDFYHQQLRELIEYKSNTSANQSELNKQFADLQKLRLKMKKKVDTRASKGRKIRYLVHKKLVNFLAPYDSSEWTEESKTELYRSLFAT